MEYVLYALLVMAGIATGIALLILRSERWDTIWFWRDWDIGWGYCPCKKYPLYWGIDIGPLEIRKNNPAVKKYQHQI